MKRSSRLLWAAVLLAAHWGAVCPSYCQTARSSAPAATDSKSPPAEQSKQSGGPSAVSSQMDPRLAKALRAAGYKYEEIKDGVAKLFFNLTDGRSHLVFVASRSQKVGPYETRKIWATAMKTQDLLDSKIANRLLMENDKQPFGTWELVKWPDGYRVLFVVAVPADLPPDQLKTVIQIVLGRADSMEKELTGEDRF